MPHQPGHQGRRPPPQLPAQAAPQAQAQVPPRPAILPQPSLSPPSAQVPGAVPRQLPLPRSLPTQAAPQAQSNAFGGLGVAEGNPPQLPSGVQNILQSVAAGGLPQGNLSSLPSPVAGGLPLQRGLVAGMSPDLQTLLSSLTRRTLGAT